VEVFVVVATADTGRLAEPLHVLRVSLKLLEKEVPQSSSVMSLTFLVETPSTYISINANIKAFSFLW
jgi:hypothetical protein